MDQEEPQPPVNLVPLQLPAPQQQAPQAPPAVVIPPPRIRFNPEPFDGTPSKYKDFTRQLAVFMRGQGIADEEQKILLALSYMRTGPAATWAADYIDRRINVANLGTYQNFVRDLDDTFADCTSAR
jgi:hypothetical protein